MAEQALTEKTGQEIARTTKSLNSTMMNVCDVMKSERKQGTSTQTPLQSVGANNTDRFMRKEDVAKNYYKSSLTTLKDILRVNKDMLKNSIQKFSTGLGSLLALGGLVGYLLTGKKELLYSVVKGLEKAFIFPMAKVFDKFVGRVASGLLKEGGKILGVFGGMAGKIKNMFGLGKTGAKVAAEVGELGLEGGAKIAGKFGLKGLLKGSGKLGLKALQKIPILGVILGPVIGLMFAWQRWKKGDHVGALMEIGSGFVSMIPGLGIPLSLAIDAMILFRDLKMPKEQATAPQQKPFTPKKGIFKKMLGGVGNFLLNSNYTGGMVVPQKGDADIEALQSPIFPTIKQQKLATNIKPKKYSLPSTPESLMSDVVMMAKKVTTNLGSGIRNIFRLVRGATLKGLKPKVLDNFTKMTQEYAAMTGQPLQVNSGYRGYDEQKKLYELYKSQGKEKYASNPDDPITGKPRLTSHMRGVSIDINSGTADILEQSGLLNKYGFYRPLMQRSGQVQSIKEPWHIQASPSLGMGDSPTVTNSDAISSQSYMSNLDKLSSHGKNDSIKELIEVTKECNKLLVKTIQSQKITSKQSISVNSAG